MGENQADLAAGGRCRGIVTLLLFTLVLAPALLANEPALQPSAHYRQLFPTPLPASGPARLQERQEAYRAFLTKPLQAQAQAWTYPTPALATATETLIDNWVDGLVQEAFGGRLRKLHLYQATIESQAKTLVAAGVTEPTVVLLSLPERRLSKAEYEQHLFAWQDAALHPPGQRPAAMALALQQLIDRQKNSAPPETLQATVADLATLLTTVLSQAGDQEEAAYLFAERQTNRYASPLIAAGVLAAVTKQLAVREQASLHLLAAGLNLTIAKAARDHAVGNVMQPAMPAYRAGMSQAETHLRRAMVLNPIDATPAAKMVHLSMLQGEGGLPVMRQWLVQALLLDMDCSEAVFNMMWGLGENWYGQPELYMDLYLEAALTRRYDSLLPAMLLENKLGDIVLGAIYDIKDGLDYVRLYPFCRKLLAEIQAAPRSGMRPELLTYAITMVALAERDYPTAAAQLANHPALRKPVDLLVQGTLTEILPPEIANFAALERFYNEPWRTRYQEWQAMAKTATPVAVDRQYRELLKLLKTDSRIVTIVSEEALAHQALALIGLAKFSQGTPFVPAARLDRPGAMLLTEISNKTLTLPLPATKGPLRKVELAPEVPAGFSLSANFALPQVAPGKELKIGWCLVPLTSGFWPFEGYQIYLVHGPESGIGIYRYCGRQLTVLQFTQAPLAPESNQFELRIDATQKLHTIVNGEAIGAPFQLAVPPTTRWLTGLQTGTVGNSHKAEITGLKMRRLPADGP